MRVILLAIILNLIIVSLGNGQDLKANLTDIDTPSLIWVDAETKRILFTSDDIISFDWNKQVFLLKLDATLDMLAWMVPHRYQYRKLFVKDCKGVIYKGQWVNRISSMGFAGPTYNPFSPNPFFSIQDGYPTRKNDDEKKDDIRFAKRLYAGLKKAGVLHNIDLQREYVGLRIDRVSHSWHDCEKDLGVRVEFFENTFRIGKEARAHIFFAGGDKTPLDIDVFNIDIKLTANKGRFRSDVRLNDIPSSAIIDGIYVCRFKPWKPIPGSKKIESGTGKISLSILFRKKKGSAFETVYRLDFPEATVPIMNHVIN